MKKYEIMFIVKSANESDEIKACAESMKQIITENDGKIVEFNELGEKKLAYAIKKEISGYYYVMVVEANQTAISELDRKSLINENILRHLVIKLDEE